jgi:hypothetical protein
LFMVKEELVKQTRFLLSKPKLVWLENHLFLVFHRLLIIHKPSSFGICNLIIGNWLWHWKACITHLIGYYDMALNFTII